MKAAYYRIYLRLLFAYRALILINRPKLGDLVTYKRRECYLIQGVAHPYWDMVPASEFYKENRRTVWRAVHRNDFKLQPLFKRFKFAFSVAYEFYMTNWYMIEFYNRVGRIDDKLKWPRKESQRL